MKIWIVHAFTDRLFTGNPAAVVPLDRWLPDAVLQAIETEPLHSEPLCLVSVAGKGRARSTAPVPLSALPEYPLVIPERSHAIRRTLEAHCALAGIKLQVAWEVSSVPAILALVRSGRGHAVLPRSAVAVEAGTGALTLRLLGEPPLVNTLCIATSATKKAE